MKKSHEEKKHEVCLYATTSTMKYTSHIPAYCVSNMRLVANLHVLTMVLREIAPRCYIAASTIITSGTTTCGTFYKHASHVRNVAQVLEEVEFLRANANPMEGEPSAEVLLDHTEPGLGRLLPLAVGVHVSRLQSAIFLVYDETVGDTREGRGGFNGWQVTFHARKIKIKSYKHISSTRQEQLLPRFAKVVLVHVCSCGSTRTPVMLPMAVRPRCGAFSSSMALIANGQVETCFHGIHKSIDQKTPKRRKKYNRRQSKSRQLCRAIPLPHTKARCNLCKVPQWTS